MPKPQFHWLEEILAGTNELESPKQYYYWSCLAAMSAICKRNVYLDQFRFYLYPNIYVFLIGPSGIRKGPPVNLAKKFVEAIRNIRVIAGRSSIQGITKEMGTPRTQEHGPMLDDASVFIAAGEFASSLVGDEQALTILTDLYDAHYHNSWKNTLVGREGETLDRPYVVMLGASNKIHLQNLITEKDIQGGFLARTFVVNAEKKNIKNSLVRAPNVVIDEGRAIAHLKEVSNLRGEFRWENGADDLYDKWYHNFDDDKEDITGTRARIHTSVLKVAMLLSLCKRLDLTLQPEDIEESLAACNNLLSDMNSVFMPGKGGETDFGKLIKLVLNDLLKAEDYTQTRQQLMARHWGLLTVNTIDPVIETLAQPGVIKVTAKSSSAKHIYYTLTKEGLDAITEMEGLIMKEGEAL